jgi:hypothetical protein
MLKELETALYALNRATPFEDEENYELKTEIQEARDRVWSLICKLDPTRVN